VVLRAVFVPEGADVPTEFTATMNPLRIPATLDRATGELRCGEGIGAEWGDAIRAEWRPARERGTASHGRMTDGPSQSVLSDRREIGAKPRE
jgi:hypothetical protein